MTEKTRKKYQKPQVAEVTLKPDEAVLGGCKSWTVAVSSGPGSKNCNQNPCTSTDGS